MRLAVTSIDKLREMAQGEVVTLSPFINGGEFNVRLKRPSLYELAEKGTIPNPLLNAASDLFGTRDGKAKSNLKETAALLRIIAESAMAEPTYKELAECGINLTDKQLIEIFNYTQTGMKPLLKFRDDPAGDPGTESKPEVQTAAQ